MKIGIISDIHGNLPALEAVLKECAKLGVTQYICLGDIATLGGNPVECVDTIRSLECPVIQGNHELYLLGKGVRSDWLTCPSYANLRHTQALLGIDRLEYLANLPFCTALRPTNLGETLAVHASPMSQFIGFKASDTTATIAERMDRTDNCTLIVGHTHEQFIRQWSNSLIVNVGSVGMPLDGSPLADFAIATFEGNACSFELRQVDYDREAFLRHLKLNGFWDIGGDIAKLFAYQTMTGRHQADRYFSNWTQIAEQADLPMSDVYHSIGLPIEVMSYFTD